MDAEHAKLERLARQWVRAHKREIKLSVCDPSNYPAETHPITIFMAGTPGAGKTEFSKSLIETFQKPMVRIDADDIRDMLRPLGYNGRNASIFQQAVGTAVSNLYGAVLNQRQSVLIDGTFAYGNWRVNIDQSLAHSRPVEIYYLYQDPSIAWEYVKLRESNQGRSVPKDVFIRDYSAALENVRQAKTTYGEKLTVYFAKNNYKKDLEYIRMDVQDIAELLPKVYTREELEECLAS